jgi:hypothetical protein
MMSTSAKWRVAVHGTVAVAALVVLALWPPVSGDLLLVPLDGSNAGTVASAAVAGGASLLGAGPLPGSLVVRGDRRVIARDSRWWTLAIVAAPPTSCGTTGRG